MSLSQSRGCKKGAVMVFGSIAGTGIQACDIAPGHSYCVAGVIERNRPEFQKLAAGA